jgi:hypothetical protein
MVVREKCSSARGILALAIVFMVSVFIAIGSTEYGESVLRHLLQHLSPCKPSEFGNPIVSLFGLIIGSLFVGIAADNKDNPGSFIFSFVMGVVLLVSGVISAILLLINCPLFIFPIMLLLVFYTIFELIDC